MKKLLIAFLLIASPLSAQIPLDRVQIVGSIPDALNFPVSASLDSFGLQPNKMTIRTSGTGGWPAVSIDAGPPSQSGTLWVFEFINGQWYAAGAERLRPNQLNGEKPVADPSAGGLSTLLGNGWLYDHRWGAMGGYNPKPGEIVGVMVVAGSTRLDTQTPLRARTGVIAFRWPSSGGSNPVEIVWREGDGEPVAEPTPPPMPPPSSPDAPEIYRQLSAVRAYAAELGGQIEALRLRVDDAQTRIGWLEARPVHVGCRASVFGMGLKCELTK